MLVATGQRYQVEAIQCAQSLKSKMPAIPITLFTRGSFAGCTAIDTIETLPEGVNSFSDKLLAIDRWAYQRMLYVDTDIQCMESVDDLFDILDRWDIAAAHAPVRQFQYAPPDVPDYFPELNAGVIAIRRTPETVGFTQRWLELHRENCQRIGPRAADQPSLRQALWESELRFLTLPPEYNLRTCMRYFIGGNAAVKIIHDRSHRADQAMEFLQTDPITKHPRVR